MSRAIDHLLENPRLFRFSHSGAAAETRLPTGFDTLDDALGGGWPEPALIEVIADRFGLGELKLMMPALAALHRREPKHWLTWVAPPHVPYAPALADADIDLARFLVARTRRAGDALWAAEQALRSETTVAALLWDDDIGERGLRRLQIAAETGSSLGVVFRAPGALRQTSPAAVRLRLIPGANGVDLSVIKARGVRPRLLKRFFEKPVAL